MRRALLVALLLNCLLAGMAWGSQSGIRSRLSRVHADMRVLGLAIENYRVDYGQFPPISAAPDWLILNHALTTPVVYTVVNPPDPFRVTLFVPDPHPVLRRLGLTILAGLGIAVTIGLFLWMSTLARPSKDPEDFAIKVMLYSVLPTLVAMSFIFDMGWAPKGYRAAPNALFVNQPKEMNFWANETGQWIIQSVGPDGDRDLEDLSLFPDLEMATFTYDITNGAMSDGDMFRSNLGERWWLNR